MNKHRVFISYSHEDQPLVDSVLRWLKNSEFRSAQIDDLRDWVSSGDDVRALITERIQRADTLLLLWSDSAARSPWVQYEVGMAQAFDVPIRVLLARESTSKLPTTLGKIPVTKIDVTSSPATDIVSNSVQSASVSTALEDLKRQSQRIEEEVQKVSEMLSSTKQKRPKGTGGSRNQRSLSAAARKRITEIQREAMAGSHKTGTGSEIAAKREPSPASR